MNLIIVIRRWGWGIESKTFHRVGNCPSVVEVGARPLKRSDEERAWVVVETSGSFVCLVLTESFPVPTSNKMAEYREYQNQQPCL